MQAYEGYLENGQFFPIGQPIQIVGRHRVIMTVFDEPVPVFKDVPKKWKGNLPALDYPIQVEDFKILSREELHER